MIESSRRGFITGLVAFVAAPAIVRVANIMPVRSVKDLAFWQFGDNLEVYGRSPMMDALPSLKEILFLRDSYLNVPIRTVDYPLVDGWASLR